MPVFEIVVQYIQTGFTHVIPLGLDHILFILSIYFISSDIRAVIIQCSIFTLAHSLALGLTVAGVILPDAAWVEPLIALSIVFTALENILHQTINRRRLLVIFVFGLIHGMGFASVLSKVGLPPGNFIIALLSFNAGVELAQIAIILLAHFWVGMWFSKKVWYKQRLVFPVSCIIASIAMYWTIQRIFQ